MIILAYRTDFLKFHNKVKVKKQTPLTVLSVVLWTFSFHFMLNIYIGSTQISRAHMDNFLLYHSHSTVLRQSGNLYVTRSRFSLSIDRVWSEPMGLALKLVWIFNFIVHLVPSIIETNWWFSRWTLLQAGIIVSDEFNKGAYRCISKIWIILVKLKYCHLFICSLIYYIAK